MKDPDVKLAVAKLREAIALHEKHLDGTAPTTGPSGMRSQMAMMKLMRDALNAIKPTGGLLSQMGMKGDSHA